jgi:hypothetical protein
MAQIDDSLPPTDMMFESLIQEYVEAYHEDEGFNPQVYEEYLYSLTNDEFNELYRETFGVS